MNTKISFLMKKEIWIGLMKHTIEYQQKLFKLDTDVSGTLLTTKRTHSVDVDYSGLRS